MDPIVATVLSYAPVVLLSAGMLAFPLGRKVLMLLFVALPLAIIALLAFSEPDLRG